MLTQPTALVTGGSRGIGRGICQALAAKGFAVAINYAGNLAAAQETQTLLGDTPTLLLQGDIGSAPDRARMIDQFLAAWGRIDLLVNNAGIASPVRVDLLEAGEESWDEVMRVNLKGPYFLTQRVANEMIKSRDVPHPQTIINISSISAYTSSIRRGDYCISKAGVSMMTQLFATRLAEYGIRVFEIRPGIIATDMTAAVLDRYKSEIEAGLQPIKRLGRPEDVGEAVAMLASSPLTFSTGEIFNVDGGFHIKRL